MNNGEANIEMREATLKYPTKSRRPLESKTSMLVKTMARNTKKTAINNPDIFSWKRHSKMVMRYDRIAHHSNNKTNQA